PRRSLLARRSSGTRGPGRRQPIAANVDQVVVVAATRDPEPDFRMLDRLLVIAEANRIPPVLVLNKLELDRGVLEPFRRRYGPAGPAGGRGLGRRPGAARPLFSRVPPLPRPVPLRQLPPSGRAGLRRTHRRGAGRVRPRPAHLLPAHLRRGQRSFLVQRAASRALIFAIIASKALSRSIPCELARQTTTNRMSASSMASEPAGSSRFLVFSPKRWLISRASSPTSSVSRARLVSGEK